MRSAVAATPKYGVIETCRQARAAKKAVSTIICIKCIKKAVTSIMVECSRMASPSMKIGEAGGDSRRLERH